MKKTNHDTLEWATIQQQKITNFWYTQLEWISDTVCLVKKPVSKTAQCIILFIWHLWRDKTIVMENKCWLLGVEYRGVCGYQRISREFFGELELFCFLIVVVVIWIYTFVKTHRSYYCPHRSKKMTQYQVWNNWNSITLLVRVLIIIFSLENHFTASFKIWAYIYI